MLYKFLSGLAKGVTHCIFRVKVVGKENVPKDGGMILAVNHKSNWDPIFAGAYCPRTLRFMAKADLFKNKLFGGLIKKLGAFPIQRGRGDIGAIKGAFSILKNNDAMLIFPEGHRIKNGRRVKAKLGVSMIAVYAEVPVIPLCISGEYKHSVNLLRLKNIMAKSLITKLCRRLPMKLCRQFIRLTIQILRKSENKND